MSRPTRIVAALVAVALIYPATSWYSGTRIQQVLDEHYADMKSHPALKVSERFYERGFFSSTERLKFDIAMTVTAEDGSLQMGEPLRMSVLNRIQHGPLPRLGTLAAATLDSELDVEGEAGAKLRETLGDKPALQAQTVVRFDGSGHSRMTTPALELELAADTERALRVAFSAFQADIDFGPGMRQYTMKLGIDRFSMEDPSLRIVMSELALDADQRRLFDDEAWLYVGKQRATIASLHAEGKDDGEMAGTDLQLERLSYEVDAPADGDYVDVIAMLGTEVLRVGGSDYGPAHYDFSIKHLHGRTLMELYRSLIEVSSDPAQLALQAEDPAAMFAPLAEPALTLLAHDPEFSIDRISFTSPHGTASLSAHVNLKGIEPDELNNPMMLLAKINAAAEASLPQGLVVALIGAQAQSPQEAAVVAAQLQQQLDMLEAQGFIVRKGGQLSSRAALSKGQLTINGQPLDLFGLGGR